jgi:hypothetical protein
VLSRRSSLLFLASVGALVLSACSGASTPSPSSSPTPTPSPAPTPTPLPPDQKTIAVLATGVGTYALAAIPVVYLHNNAAFHGAASVVAHFTTHRTGQTLGSLDSVPVNLSPGETLAVTADCTDACNGATSVGVTVTVGTWSIIVGPVFATVSAAYSCRPCRAGHGFGDVKGSLQPSSTIAQGTAVVGFATCRNRAGTILGGGSAEIVWQSGSTLAVDVPVVLNAGPSSCSLGASTRW